MGFRFIFSGTQLFDASNHRITKISRATNSCRFHTKACTWTLFSQ